MTETPEQTLATILETIRHFNLLCAIEEETDTDAVWNVLGSISHMICGKPLPNWDGVEIGLVLDELVLAQKSREASEISNEGPMGQLRYLEETLNQGFFSGILAQHPNAIPEVE